MCYHVGGYTEQYRQSPAAGWHWLGIYRRYYEARHILVYTVYIGILLPIWQLLGLRKYSYVDSHPLVENENVLILITSPEIKDNGEEMWQAISGIEAIFTA